MPTRAPERALASAVTELLGPAGPEARFSDQVAMRRVEFDSLVELLMRDVTPGTSPADATPVARAIAAGSLGEQHLWRDLGLPSRAMLRAVLEAYFEPLAADNMMDMRWKKFLYRRLCRWEGFASCRAPSCTVCADFSECFGSE